MCSGLFFSFSISLLSQWGEGEKVLSRTRTNEWERARSDGKGARRKRERSDREKERERRSVRESGQAPSNFLCREEGEKVWHEPLWVLSFCSQAKVEARARESEWKIWSERGTHYTHTHKKPTHTHRVRRARTQQETRRARGRERERGMRVC